MAKYIIKIFGNFSDKTPPKILIKDTSNKDVTNEMTLLINPSNAKESCAYFMYNGANDLYPVFIESVLGNFYKYKIEKIK